MTAKRTLYMHRTGPLVQFGENGVLYISGLNPEVSTKWRMTRGDLLRFGLRIIREAVFGKRT